MKVFYPTPAERISPYIQAILIIENYQVTSPFLLPLFANGTPTLLFSTTDAYMGDDKHNLTLFGQTVIPEHIQIRQNFKLVAYFLKPHALEALFDISACELTDRPIDLNLLTGESELQEKLVNAETAGQILQLIDDYLYAKVKAIRFEDKRLTYAAEKIAHSSDKNILTVVKDELYVTERTFQRMFERHIGVSANMFRRINQFNRAFNQINRGDFQEFSAVAYKHGYADQSHFIKVFKEFTHFTPSDYLRTRPGA